MKNEDLEKREREREKGGDWEKGEIWKKERFGKRGGNKEIK